LGTGLAGAGADEFRTFTSADGSKKVEAKLTDYDATTGVASLSLKTGAKIKAPIDKFSPEDQEYAQAAMERFVVARRIQIEISEHDEKLSEKDDKRIGGKVTSREGGYNVELRNNGSVAISEVTAKYKYFVTRVSAKGDKELVTEEGELEWTGVDPREEQTSRTRVMAMTSVRPLPKSECVGGT